MRPLPGAARALTFGALAASGACAIAGCGVDRGMIEAGLGAAATRYAALGAEVCGHPTAPLAAARVRDVEASSLVEGDVPGGHGRVFQLGTGSATIAGHDDEGRRCARKVAFTYRAVKGSKRHPAPWQMAHLGPFVGAAASQATAHAPTAPTSRRGDTALHDHTIGPDSPAFDVHVALTARQPITVYLHPVEDRDLAADALSLRVLLGASAVFEDPRVGVTQLRVLVAPVTGVYTLRVATTSDRPMAARLELKEGTPDAMGP